MYHHPHYPPPAPQQQDNDRLGQDLYRGTDIVMIIIAICHRSTLGERYSSVVELVAEKIQHKAEADPAGIAGLGWLFVLAGFPGVDPAFHILLAHQMRSWATWLWATSAPLTFPQEKITNHAPCRMFSDYPPVETYQIIW